MTEQIKDVLARILKQYKLEERVAVKRLFNDWPDYVGPELAKQCIPVKMVGTVLYLKARNTAWRSELASNHDQLLNLVKKNTEIPELTKLVFLDEE